MGRSSTVSAAASSAKAPEPAALVLDRGGRGGQDGPTVTLPPPTMKRLLIVAHAPSANTLRMREAVLEGARHRDIAGVETVMKPPLEAGPEDVLAATALILGTTENLGYMSGALKDFFDRVFYPCLDRTDGLPYAAYIRAGRDGTGTRRAIASICGGLRWREVQEPLVCRGDWQESFVEQCRDLGTAIAAGLEAAIF
jgi:hypothetical protein